MFRFLKNNLRLKMLKISTRPTSQCYFTSDVTEIIIGGGLEKPQGGLKEEKYFYEQNHDLITKICQQGKGTQLKGKDYVRDSYEFEKVLNASDDRTALRETCSLNKHKNCLEEAFFLNEQNDCCKKLCKEDNVVKEETQFQTTAENKAIKE